MSDVRENNIVSDEEPAGQERPKMGQHGLIVYLKRYNESKPTGYGSQEDGEGNGCRQSYSHFRIWKVHMH